MATSTSTLVLMTAFIGIAVHGLTLNSNTDLKVYTTAMIRAGATCESVVGDNAHTVTAKNCRSSCNYPAGVCVTTFNTRDVFATPSHKCVTVSSACQAAVKADASTSGSSGGGSATTRRPSATTQRTAATRRTFSTARTAATRRTSAPRVTSAPSSGATCTGSRSSGTRSSTVRYSNKYYFDARSKSCKSFLYWGTGGNSNRHENKAACESACVKGSATVSTSSSSGHSLADCSLPSRKGAVTRTATRRCSGSERRYSALKSSRGVFCVSFTYSNCAGAGNENNFESRAECEKVCK